MNLLTKCCIGFLMAIMLLGCGDSNNINQAELAENAIREYLSNGEYTLVLEHAADSIKAHITEEAMDQGYEVIKDGLGSVVEYGDINKIDANDMTTYGQNIKFEKGDAVFYVSFSKNNKIINFILSD